MKTKADYDGESKKGKLRSPKIAEFSISIIEGVSERLKVSVPSLPSCVSCIIPFPLSLTLPHKHMPESSCLPAAEDICHDCHNISSAIHVVLLSLVPPSCPVSSAACQAAQGDIMHNDSLNPIVKLSLIQLLPWWWPLNGSISPTSLKVPVVSRCVPSWHHTEGLKCDFVKENSEHNPASNWVTRLHI